MNMTFLSAARVVIVLSVIASPAVHAQQAQSGTTKSQEKVPVTKPLAEDHPAPQGFSVVLVLGDTQGAIAKDDNVPAAARKALTDLKDFLPYKGYRLLDTQFTAWCCGSPGIISRLRGPDDQDYELELTPRAIPAGKWSIHFALREPVSAAPSGDYSGALREKEASMLTAQRNELERRLADMRQKLDERHPEVIQIKAQIADLERRMDAFRIEDTTRKVSAAAGNLREARRVVIDTSFNMDVGETVVVGTSRVKGDKALIALLTAIAPQRK